MKKLIEKRNALIEKMEELLNGAKEETRALNEEEKTEMNDIKEEIRQIDETLAQDDEFRKLDKKKMVEQPNEERAILEERAFANHIRGIVENRADANMTTGDNGAVIPTSIAQKIIKKVYEISPLYQMATRYNVGGTLQIPYYDEDSGTVTMAYATEFNELESTSGKFSNIELKGFLAGALTKVSKSLINNSQFDIVPFVINAMAESISKWIEQELLVGTTNKVEGLSTVTQTVTASTQTTAKADEFIDLQEMVPDAYQANAIWIMSKKTRTALRKLKDGQGNYLLNKDATSRWGYTLFGKDVYVSDNMPDMAASETAVYYGDMSGLAVKLAESMNIQVLREKYATQHAVGVVSWIEIDSKVENAQKIAKLVMKAGV